MERQKLLEKQKLNYSYGSYNKSNEKEQWIRITEGCPNQCPYCYEPKEFKIFEIPEIIRNNVKIMDMNLICKKDALYIIRTLANKRVNKKKVYYELVCGIDYRYLTKEIAEGLYLARFLKMRLAWDFSYKLQKEIKKAIEHLKKAGYKSKDIMVFMICNWNITYEENLRKLDLCKVWNVQVADCYYDNQTFPNVIPINWTDEQLKDFRKRVRKHNQLVNFGIDPEI